ncbi:uncharacterized protein JCM6883_002811 [Sporobolomyces salmoneus]|uniref:uncharacterized protein n=1 Tax=Sporobolomyces salmoneus TaxID=183962 RepID=UPI00317A8B58
MSTRSKRKVNYAEVDSDVDMPSDEEQKWKVTRDKGKGKQVESDEEEEFGATGDTKPRKKKSKLPERFESQSCASSAVPEVNVEPPTPFVLDVERLFKLPAELFAEILFFVGGRTLINLAKVNKMFRNFLLSRDARAIWSRRRLSLGFPLPDGLSELQFALLYYPNTCQACPRAANVTPYENLFLRVRLCYFCLDDYTINAKKIKKEWPDLHPQAVNCVRQWKNESFGIRRPQIAVYLITDLEEVNNELAELEELDEATVSEIQSIRSKSSSTRTRNSATVKVDLKADAVDTYVQEKQEWVSLEIQKNHQRVSKKAAEQQEARLAAEKEAHKLFLETLKNNHQWTDEEIARHERSFNPDFAAPKLSLELDPEGWETYHTAIKEQLAAEAARLAAAAALDARQTLISPYHQSLELDKSSWPVFPSFQHFLKLKTVRPLWEKESASIDDEKWKKARPEIVKELDGLQEKNRIEAIRQILAANQGLTSVSSFSKKPSDYPESTYDEAYFARPTSLFVTKLRSGRIDISRFPFTTEQGDYHGPASLKGRINVRQVHVMRNLVEAAGLKPEKTSVDDLDNLKKAFRWRNNPKKLLRTRLFSWSELLDEAISYGPSNAKIVEGDTIEIDYDSSDPLEPAGTNASNSDSDDTQDDTDDEGGEGTDHSQEEEEGESLGVEHEEEDEEDE